VNLPSPSASFAEALSAFRSIGLGVLDLTPWGSATAGSSWAGSTATTAPASKVRPWTPVCWPCSDAGARRTR
jgi:hypothetical protein